MDYEIKTYIIGWYDPKLNMWHTQEYGTEEAALERYRNLLIDPNAYSIRLEKVLVAVGFPWDND